jgi:hypothetical protein
MMLFRKILFFVLATVYVVVCPLLVLYALGYIYSPVEREFVQTGLIHLSTVPAGADIYLEKSRFTNRTPATIEGLFEGNYKITLIKKRYKSWTQSISIEAGKAAAFNDILLTPTEWPRETMTTFGCKELIPTENGAFFITKTTNLGSFLSYDRKGPMHSLLPMESPFEDFEVAKLHQVAKSNAYIFYGGPLLDKRYLLLNLEDKEHSVTDITNLIGDKFSSVTWNADDSTKLYTQEKGCVNKIDVKKSQVLPCFLDNIKGFGIFNDWIYVLDRNDILVRYRSDKQRKENLSFDTQTAKRLFERSDFYNITVKDAGIFFLGNKGDFLASTPPYHIAYEGVTGFSFQNRTDKLLYWGKKFIGIVQFSNRGEKTVFQEKFRIQTILENAANIKQAFWVYDDSHIIYNDGGKIYLVEIEPQGSHHIELVVRVKDDTDIFYNDDNYTLYYLEEPKGNLMQLKLIPEAPLIKMLIKGQD